MSNVINISIKKNLLLFGVTGMTGKYVLTAALTKLDEFNITCYVRSPNKIPHELKSQISIIEGDFENHENVKSAVHRSQPDVIIITTAARKGNKPYPFNQLTIPQIVNELANNNRLPLCKLIYLSDSFSPSPPDTKLKCHLSCIASCFGVKSNILDNTATLQYLYGTSAELSYIIVKMGKVTEGPSNGRLSGNTRSQTASLKFIDMGTFLVSIACNDDNMFIKFNRQAIYATY